MRRLPAPLLFLLLSALVPLPATNAADDADGIELTAWSGQPFGVATLSITPRDNRKSQLSRARTFFDGHHLLELGDQALYPVVERSGPATTESRTAAPNSDVSWTVYFLFRPADRVRASLGFDKHTPEAQVVSDPAAHRRAMDRWWTLYVARARQNAAADRYPAEIDQYLTAMLARRIGRAMPSLKSRSYIRSERDARAIGVLTGTESIRLAMQKEALLGSESAQAVADQPLPEATSPPAIEIPEPAEDVVVEPLAMGVPLECFYARFGSFENFMWFRDRANVWGADLRFAAAARAIDYDVSERLQRQLELPDTDLAQLLGPAVISDVALIGTDTFVREGASLGVLFESKNNAVLSASLTALRNRRAAQDEGTALTAVTLEGAAATLLSSPDNRVRSFYVVRGNQHLVTNSRTIAARFVEVSAAPDTSLGASQEFRYARTLMPVTRDDSAFLHLSDAFFRSLVSPASRIEMTRRARSENEIQLVRLAQLAARAEGTAANSLDDLIAHGLLPRGFGQRPDGSRIVVTADQIVDSLRGATGSFLPVADVTVSSATSQEVESYKQFALDYARLWTWMDPATVALQHHEERGRERLTMDLHVYPFPLREFGLLTMLRPATSKRQIPLPPQAILLLEANVLGFQPLFAGAVDSAVPFVVRDDELIVATDEFERLPWFLGAAGNNALEQFGYSELAKLPEDEIRPLPRKWLGETSYGLRHADVVVVAAREDAVRAVGRQLEPADGPRPAQYRAHVGDLSGSEVSALLHAEAWSVAVRISRGNSILLNHLGDQFRLAPDAIPAVAETLLQGKPVCPLGGDYRLDRQIGRGWKSDGPQDWQSYRQPFLRRMHGAELEITAEGRTLQTHLEMLLDK